MNDDLADTPLKRTLIAISAGIALALPLVLMLFVVFQPDGEFYLGRRSSPHRIAISRELGIAVFTVAIGLFLALILAALRHYLRQPARSADQDDTALRLPPGELVRWTGRPGWRSISGPRLFGITLAVLVPALLVWWATSVWAGDDPLTAKLFFMVIPLAFLFGSVIPGLIGSSGIFYNWLCDLFGTIAITERRVVWLSPLRRRIYREVAGADIVDAFAGPAAGKRGTLTLVRRKRDDVEHVYLAGVPDPTAALAAVMPLSRAT